MKKVLVFFNSQPAELVKTLREVNTIRRVYPNGEEAHLKIMLSGIHSVGRKKCEIFIAADRNLENEEIISAANALL
ncbi:TPA: hypothetical protein L7W18_004696 [Klebsiella pneumoniae]|jgi:biopolymer transport protein ExbD|uniref:Uncharacterized protein n=1 Tax=Salmonella enterica TaxID=28901 RepID=A0A7H0RWT3_SALER|nr:MULTISPECIES: hypothetical protein [Enterobacteriaceae]ECA5023907.1 hypothetical protein [Salmonella enterica subsp. enterica serovar Ohio]ECE8812324.1 hypothetical protein [Salmonella enterica subsp. enterica serovar Virchow]EDX3259307.1 hypothetical protein [Salmonella enterica subsp. enterica serovar Mbandaka]EHX8394578.1 hypothetical protein [Salmonella enterica subsp. enterica serovar Idikan]MDZ1373280.1 hypothetical protein [Klebsiella pneumoniae]HAT7495825.1 hypothetical protein [Ra